MKVISNESYTLLLTDKISNEEFLNMNNITKNELNHVIYDMIKESFKKNDARLLEKSVYIMFQFKLFNNEFIELLNRLIVCDWHTQHENIAMILQKVKSPSSIDALFTTAKKQYKYLEYDEFYALSVKCIWALGAIGTGQAYDYLNELSKSNNEIIAENAKKQLRRLKQK